MAEVKWKYNKAGEPVGPEEKYTSGVHEYPKERECEHLYFYRLHRDGGRGDLPYFYDIEVDEENLTVRTWHGKPGKFMTKNHPKKYESPKELRKQVKFITQIVPIVILLVIAVIIGAIIFSIFMAIFNMTSGLRRGVS